MNPRLILLAALPFFAISPLAACGDDDAVAPTTTDGGAIDATADVIPGADAEATPDSQAVLDSSPATDGASADAGPSCSAALNALLKPVASVSSGVVTNLGTVDGVTTLHIDATAGGSQAAAQNPRIYINLATKAAVAVTDETAPAATTWDLALKRPILFTNSGEAGAGLGGARFVTKDFAAVTAADAAPLAREDFVTETCEARVDATGAVLTTFDGWYDYNPATNGLTPKAGTWIVGGADGTSRYKLKIRSYYANVDGTDGTAGGRYLLDVAPL